MYVCVCIYIYIYIWIHTYVNTNRHPIFGTHIIYAHTYIHMAVQYRIYIYTHIYASKLWQRVSHWTQYRSITHIRILNTTYSTGCITIFCMSLFCTYVPCAENTSLLTSSRCVCVYIYIYIYIYICTHIHQKYDNVYHI